MGITFFYQRTPIIQLLQKCDSSGTVLKLLLQPFNLYFKKLSLKSNEYSKQAIPTIPYFKKLNNEYDKQTILAIPSSTETVDNG
jgi:hypothetical protein